ncbi:MAG: hypothetical protein JKP96_11485 [Oceanicaulis sp.]|jgi:hypothetical protein|nr:hypothetical protein [Oceanicaulis sp.]
MITIIGYLPGEDVACEILSGAVQSMSARMNEELVYFLTAEPVFQLEDAPEKASFISVGEPPFTAESEA